MKFRFLGDLDAPDWLLAEISLLSKMSSVRMKLLVNQVILQLTGSEVDWAKVDKLTKEAKFDDADVRAVVAALDFIISNAAKYNVDETTLSKELQQLGLPKEHADSLCRPFKDKKDSMRQAFKQSGLHLPSLKGLEWRVDYILGSSGARTILKPSVQLELTTSVNNDRESSTSFEMSADKFSLLHSELKAARAMMDQI